MVPFMNRAIALLITVLALLLPGGAALAQEFAPSLAGARVVKTASWVEEWDPASQRWVRVDDSPADTAQAAHTATIVTQTGGVTITETVFAEQARFLARPAQAGQAGARLAQYGPFRVLDETRAALVGATDAATPRAFAAMLAAHPGLAVIEFVDAPGTSHDLANLALGRAIRAAGLATHVPDGGSARSGAVELFLAGTRRTMAPSALFAVHSWRDEAGREPADFAPEAPENRLYLDYYAEMGMTPGEARAFYAMTNSVPHASALWLEGADMAHWLAPTRPTLPRPTLNQPAPMAGAPVSLALTQRGFATKLARAAVAQGAIHSAAMRAPQPRIDYARLGPDLGGATLALLDSGVAFP